MPCDDVHADDACGGRPLTVAIDGPAGVGKSTVARKVAERLGLIYLDTGAMYRAVAVRARDLGRDPAHVAQNIQLRMGDTITADGHDITRVIREPEISQLASRLSALPAVRRALVAMQRALIADGGYVAEGRDIGTVVAPHAQVKVFLTAAEEERARRRAKQTGASFSRVLAEQRKRDRRDSTRTVSPLRPADDATVIDCTSMTVEQVVERVCQLAADTDAIRR